jgi:hypothetical protein
MFYGARECLNCNKLGSSDRRTMTAQATVGIHMNANAYVPDTEEPAKLRHGVCEFLEGISKELCKMAYDNGFDTLAVLFDMAREDAKRIRVNSDDHFDRP